MKKTMKDLIKDNQEKGYHFFDKDTIEFWKSRNESSLMKEKYFITSEPDWNGNDRRFTIREYNWETGMMVTIGEFRQFKTLKEAYEYLIEILPLR